MEKIKVVTLFSGYDSQCLALDRLKRDYHDFDYELVAWAEIDKYAIQAHNALFPQWADRNLGDITKIDWSMVDGDIDLLPIPAHVKISPTRVCREVERKAVAHAPLSSGSVARLSLPNDLNISSWRMSRLL